MFWRDPHFHNIGCYAPLDDIAKVKTLIKGRMVPNKHVTCGKVTKEFTKMSVVDYYVMCVHESVKDVVPDDESKEWARRMLEKHMIDYDVPNDYGKKKKAYTRKRKDTKKKMTATKKGHDNGKEF